MLEKQTVRTQTDERNRCRNRSWLSMKEGKRFRVGKQVAADELRKTPERLSMNIYQGQEVLLSDNKTVGSVTKLFYGGSGQMLFLSVRSTQFFGSHKMVPITAVRDISSNHTLLNVTREQFVSLPEFQDDSDIEEAVDHALWDDGVLRVTDYAEISVQVQDGVLTMFGHVMNRMNQWRAETAVKDIPGVLEMNSYLIADDQMEAEVAGVIGQIQQDGNNVVFSKVENGVVVLLGTVDTTTVREAIEGAVGRMPWVRGVINEIRVPGTDLDPEDLRFFQPSIGKELFFRDSTSATIRHVVINPRNRRVVAVVVSGKLPASKRGGPARSWEESYAERLAVLPVRLLRSAGMINLNSDEVTKYEAYEPARYVTPGSDWQPPYPYCTDEVLWKANRNETTEKAINRFENEGGRTLV